MHDVAFFERQGLASVALLSSAFAPQAQYQATSLGLEGAVKLFVAHPISDQTLEQMIKKADSVYEDVVRALSSDDVPRPVISESGEVECAS